MKNKYYVIFALVLSIVFSIFSLCVFKLPAMALEGTTNGLTPIEVKNTNNLIEMNLYNYDSNINFNNRDSGGIYPAFQQSFGGTGVENGYSLEELLNTFDEFDKKAYELFKLPSSLVIKEYAELYLSNQIVYYMGDLITADLATQTPYLYKSNINNYNSEAPDPIFWPVTNAMHNKLVYDNGIGYPAIKYGNTGLSLKYLFSDNTYAKKQNTDNISELFKYDEKTGKYYYSSRENHAEFDKNTNKFLVYNEILTPNYLMYPFGNFMPLNKINTQTTKTFSIDKAKVQEMLTTILNKYNSEKDPLLKTQYNYLYKNLKNYDIAMTTVYGEDYTPQEGFQSAVNAIKEFQSFTTEAKNKLYSKFKDLYSINYDEKSDFFFGFEMKTNFIQPKDGKIGDDNMIFHFEGDDDVWVYIDDVLFLDLSGIHAQVGGEIDFAKGEVRYYGFDNKNYGVSKTEINANTIKTIKFKDIPGIDLSKLDENKVTLKELEVHTLNFYYMERGASSGVMTLEFNMPLVQKNAITIEKQVTSNEGTFGRDTYQFQVIKPNSGSTFSTNQLFVGSNYTYDVYNSNGDKINTAKTDSNGIITLNKGEYAVIPDIENNAGKYIVREIIPKDIYTQYASVYINDSIITGKTITIGSKEYMSFESSTNDMINGAGKFIFTNKVNPNNLGKLVIKKIVNGSATDNSFKIKVKIGGEELPIGSTYKIDSSTYTVNEKGIINLKHNQVATIDKIFAGTSYEVCEDDSSANGYIVTYNGSITGTVGVSSAVNVEVINTEKTGLVVEIPVYKNTTNSDGVEYTYTFVLEDLLDDSKEPIETNVTVKPDGTGSGKFVLNYSYLDHTSSLTTHKYKIYEKKVSTLNGIEADNKYVSYDEGIYEVEVKVANNSGILSYECIIKKDNEVKNKIEFNNERVSSLTLKKIVEGNSVSGGFNFKIESVGLNGTYKTNKGNIEFNNGVANVKLSNEESITIYGLPYASIYKITETNSDGYVSMYKINSGDFSRGNSVANVTLLKRDVSKSQSNPLGISYDTFVTFKNVEGYELPKTGSSGMLIMTFLGTLLISLSSIYLFKRN